MLPLETVTGPQLVSLPKFYGVQKPVNGPQYRYQMNPFHHIALCFLKSILILAFPL